MILSVQLEHNPNRLRFEEFSTALLEYQEESPQDGSPFVNLTVTDTKTKQVVSVFLKEITLQEAGISPLVWKNVSPDAKKLSNLIYNVSVIERLLQRAIPIVSEQLTRPYLTFFQNTTYANRVICGAIHGRVKHLSRVKGVPGIYLHFFQSSINVFINLKKTSPLGKGSYGKVRKVLWLNALSNGPEIIAKKTLNNNGDGKDIVDFKKEMAALREFSGKRGILPLISCGKYDDKYAIFMPLYECSLWQCMTQRLFPLSLNDILSATSEWLDGLATISEKGIHGDLKPLNLLLRRREGGIDGAIADFGSYRPYDEAEHGLTTNQVAPPEYYTSDVVTPKHDIWGMGLSLYEMISQQWLPCWPLNTTEKMAPWISRLTPDWILQYPTRADTPPFLLNLINRMLDPRADYRPTTKEAFECFSSGYSSFVGKT